MRIKLALFLSVTLLSITFLQVLRTSIDYRIVQNITEEESQESTCEDALKPFVLKTYTVNLMDKNKLHSKKYVTHYNFSKFNIAIEVLSPPPELLS
ncbi:hypothetical protein [Croceivirga sp. JEA036]|uniref:hypothetical protein n=1 Tax=Croceivirga sp. JEA036 TaxID=2721162 RepID=UPI001438C3D7|nr:hypothetical protein [Croceivirga sp. JEA036]NJB36944.1 hypothetical protein [Croceivirga sp. JEA036]